MKFSLLRDFVKSVVITVVDPMLWSHDQATTAQGRAVRPIRGLTVRRYLDLTDVYVVLYVDSSKWLPKGRSAV